MPNLLPTKVTGSRKVFILRDTEKVDSSSLEQISYNLGANYLNLASELEQRDFQMIVNRYRLDLGTWIIDNVYTEEVMSIFDYARDTILVLEDRIPETSIGNGKFRVISETSLAETLNKIANQEPNNLNLVHKEISPIEAIVDEKFLYNGDETKDGKIECQIIGISCYPNSTITLTILIGGTYLFSDIPLVAICNNENNENDKLSLDNLIYRNCPNEAEFTVFELKNLKGPVYVKFKKVNKVIEGEYLLSIDFWQGNELYHLIKLNNGQMCFMPNHKLSFKKQTELPSYRPMKTTWKV